MEPQIKESLISLLDGIKRSNGAVIGAEMAKLDGYLDRAKAEGNIDPRLEHFLGNRSYAKALAYLGGGDLLRPGFGGQAATPPGGCSSQQTKPAKG